GLGLVLGATLFVIVAMIVGQTLSGRAASGTLFGGAVVGIVTLLEDQFATWQRLSLPQLQASLPFVVAGVVLLLGFFVAREFRNYSLRTKLTVAFVIVTVIPLITLGFYYNIQSRNQLYLATQQRLGALADETADTVDTFVTN